jgi:gliding motility-associated-like protein
MKNFFSAFILFFCFKSLFASHIVGGEMYYEYLGNENYKVTLVVYRDCYNGQAPYDSEASLGVFDSQGNLIENYLVPINDSSFIPNAINSPCLTPPVDVCVQVAHYYQTMQLPPLQGGYTIAYQRCCRNYSCLNILQFTGATYTCEIPEPQYANDDNPVYQNLPPTFICANAPFTFDHSATDADGDSLVYSLYTPYDGADEVQPQPSPPSSPPYSPIVYVAPYWIGNVMGGVPLAINPQTGILTATPNSEGQFVYGVLVKEYRNGVQIGETRRDFQVNVTPCPNYTVASIYSPTLVCGSLEAHFQNTSYGANSYSWTFGDPTTTNDISTQVNPSYTYPDTGRYPIMLVAYGVNTNCNDTAWGEARVYPAFYAKAGMVYATCTHDFQFIDSSFSLNSTPSHWSWSFGDNQYSNVPSPAHHYAIPGNYTVTFIAYADSGCFDTSTVHVDVDPIAVALFSVHVDTCGHYADFYNASNQADIYYWDFGDNSYGNDPHPIHEYDHDGNFSATLIASNDSGCSDTAYASFYIPVVPIANFAWNILPCDSVAHFQNLSLNSNDYEWSFGDDSTSNSTDPSHMFQHSGSYVVTLHSSGNTVNCIDEHTDTVIVYRTPVPDFQLALDTCNFLLTATNLSQDATIYHWTFSDGYTDQSENPGHHFNLDGDVSLQLVAENVVGCAATLTLNALIPPLPKSHFTWTHIECDSLVTFRQQSLYSVSYKWDFGDGETNFDSEAEHIYHKSGFIPVNLISTSQYGCKDTANKTIYIIIRTPAEFEAFLDSCSGVVQFKNLSPLAVLYDWNFGDEASSTQQNPVYTFHYNGTNYVVTLTVNKETACQEFKQKTLQYDINQGEILFAPNSFTPNGDGLNDKFELSLWKQCEFYSLSIFDRWGHSVYRNEDAGASSWDGTSAGKLVPEGVYVYVLEGSGIKKTGYVLLIR